MRYRVIAVAALLAGLSAACSGSGSATSPDNAAAGGTDTTAASSTEGVPGGPSSESPTTAPPGATGTQRGSGKSPTTTGPEAQSTATTVASSSAQWDDIDRAAPVPPGSVRVVGGKTQSGTVWRLYVYRDAEKRTCLQWYEKARSGSGGPFARCDRKPPLSVGGSSGSDGRFLFGLTSGQAVKVRAEHVEGQAENFDTVAVTGFGERFWGGEIGRTPLKRIVALDASGKVIASQDDVSSYNLAP